MEYKTYDADLLSELNCEDDLIYQYVQQDQENFRLRQLATHRGPPLSNPHAYSFQQFAERIILPLMNDRHIRGWHYTRLTDEETELIRHEGIYLSTLATIKRRLSILIAAGILSKLQAEMLYAGGPFHYEGQAEARSNKFWMTAFPLPTSYDGITSFLESWGGESIFFLQRDDALKDAVSRIGTPRVIELAVPLKHTNHAYSAAKAVLAHYGRSIGCEPDGADFEFYATRPLNPEAVLAIHSAGDPPFKALAQGYSAEFAPDASLDD